MANRLEQIKRIKQGIGFANDLITNSDWYAAIVVQNALIEQLLAVVEVGGVNHQSDPDQTITFTEDCGGDE